MTVILRKTIEDQSKPFRRSHRRLWNVSYQEASKIYSEVIPDARKKWRNYRRTRKTLEGKPKRHTP
jgi:ABC-type sulfate transport system substrate-binding protein